MGVEQELIEATGFNPRKPYKERQEHLTALLRAADGLDDDDFGKLTDEASEWVSIAVKALKAKDDIPDFEDGEGSVDHEDEEAAEDAEAQEAEEDVDPTDDNPVDDTSEEAEEEVEEKPAKGKAKKAKEKAKPEKVEKAETPAKAKAKAKVPTEDDVELNKFGIMKGTKSHDAILMFEKGTTAADVKEKVGGTYYNLLRKLVADGHHLEKDGPFQRLTHKDDVGKAKAKKK